jgi:hypothetical protein
VDCQGLVTRWRSVVEGRRCGIVGHRLFLAVTRLGFRLLGKSPSSDIEEIKGGDRHDDGRRWGHHRNHGPVAGGAGEGGVPEKEGRGG